MNAILLIHGFPFDHQMWRHQLAGLRGWQCLAPDLQGAGTNPGPRSPDDYSVASYATDLVRVLDETAATTFALLAVRYAFSSRSMPARERPTVE